MIYLSKIKRVISWDDYQGTLLISLGALELLTAYQIVSGEFIFHRFQLGENQPVDVWLVFGKMKHSTTKEKKVMASISSCHGELRGQISRILNKFEYRIDCGKLIIDVNTQDYPSMEVFMVGDYVEISGEFQVFFPDTSCNKSEIWSVKV